MSDKKAQQEMVGFVLIVGIVMVGIVVFMVISLRSPAVEKSSLEVEYLLEALMKQTTDCAVRFVPEYDDFEGLFKSCYENDRCSNLNKMACDYLNESLKEVVESLLMSEASVGGYQIDFFVKGDSGSRGLLNIFNGECNGAVSSAQKNIISGKDSLIIRLKLCRI